MKSIRCFRPFPAATLAICTLAVLLAGCAAEPGAAPAPSDPATKSAPGPLTETPSPTPPQQQTNEVVIPSCDEILPLETVRQFLGDDRIELFPFEAAHVDLLSTEAFGPSAMQAYENAQQLTHCNWAYPQSDGVASVVFAELTPQDRAAFTTALDDSVFIKRMDGEAVVYEDLDPQRRKSLPVRHGFVDNLWVGMTGPISGYFLDPSLARIVELNEGSAPEASGAATP